MGCIGGMHCYGKRIGEVHPPTYPFELLAIKFQRFALLQQLKSFLQQPDPFPSICIDLVDESEFGLRACTVVSFRSRRLVDLSGSSYLRCLEMCAFAKVLGSKRLQPLRAHCDRGLIREDWVREQQPPACSE